MSAIKVYKLTGPLWAIQASYFSRALVDAAQAIPGLRFNWDKKRYEGYVDAVTAIAARLTFQGVGVDAALLPGVESWRSAQVGLFDTTASPGFKLRDYQVDGVRFFLARSEEGALLADSMRLGKSLTAIVAARTLARKTLVVCPPHLVGVWGRKPEALEGPGEIAKGWPAAWAPHPESGGRGVVILEGVKPVAAAKIRASLAKKKRNSKEQEQYEEAQADLIARVAVLQDAKVIVCHNDILYAWADVLIEWGVSTLIIDELHLWAGHDSRRSTALKSVRAIARNTMALTGTPVTGIPKTAFTIFEILSPGRFGYFWSQKSPLKGGFANVFCDCKMETVGIGERQKTVPNFKGRSNLDTPDGVKCLVPEETLRHRVDHFMLRRLKRDVDTQLPPKQRVIIDVEIPARSMIGVGLHSLDKEGKELRRALDLAADAKLKTVVQRVIDHLSEGEKVICFCYRQAFTETVAQEVLRLFPDAKTAYIHGGVTSVKERDKRLYELKAHDGPACLVGTIDTISTGIDLSFSSVGIVAELTWQYEEIEQLEERLYAFGKETKALLEYIIARGTGDELILRAVIQKLDTAEKVVGSSKDGMKEDLSKRKENSMKRLYDAICAMQQEQVPRRQRR